MTIRYSIQRKYMEKSFLCAQMTVKYATHASAMTIAVMTPPLK